MITELHLTSLSNKELELVNSVRFGYSEDKQNKDANKGFYWYVKDEVKKVISGGVFLELKRYALDDIKTW